MRNRSLYWKYSFNRQLYNMNKIPKSARKNLKYNMILQNIYKNEELPWNLLY